MHQFTEKLLNLPFLTEDLPGTGGKIKSHYDDFRVEEIPLYQPCGTGDFLYVWIEKKGMTTPDVIATFSKKLHIPRKSINYAGLKDARAITRQWFSIEGAAPELIRTVDIPKMKILDIIPHTNPLKIGYLAGNRFSIRLRELKDPAPVALLKAQAIIARIQKIGLPNFYGPQRFGHRFDSHILGRYVLCGRHKEFIDLMLGQPKPGCEPSQATHARELYDRQEYKTAYNAWPMHYYEHRRTLKMMINNNNDQLVAYKYLERRSKRFYVSALQSAIFNMVVISRMPDIHKILLGDLAWIHYYNNYFTVEDVAAAQSRADNFEISPSGPLMGSKMSHPVGPAGEIEMAIIQQAQLSESELENMNYYRLRGSRRPIRIMPRNMAVAPGMDAHGEFLDFSFELDPGGYATTLLREITKISNLA